MFKLTAVGIRHAEVRYKETLARFTTIKCVNNDIISDGAKDAEGTIDYEMLAIKIRGESSEVSRSCTVTNDKVKSVEIRSTPDGIGVVIKLN